MESLNHDMNEMDALFRKAAKGYMLKAGDGDWESISGKLLTKPLEISPAKKNKRRKYFGLVILLFLVSAGSMLYYSVTNETEIGNNRNILNKNASSSSLENPKKGLESTDNSQSDYIKSIENIGEKSDIGSLSNEEWFSEKLRANNVGDKFVQSADQIVTRTLIPSPSPGFRDRTISRFNGVASVFHLAIEDKVKSVDQLTTSKGEKTVPLNRNIKGSYLVVTGGPDFSNVKSQAFTKTGYNLGVLAGYRFNRKVSVESGILWSRKKYYSDGKYFSMNKVGPSMPSNMKIMTVDGEFTFLEIPLKLKYDFAHKKRSNLFISSGISANICLKERNNYLTHMNGLQEYHIGLYKDVSVCPISLISVSAGYEYGLHKSRTLRVEPYIKIPLTKVGMGSLPVFSTGINVAISNLFSKGRH